MKKPHRTTSSRHPGEKRDRQPLPVNHGRVRPGQPHLKPGISCSSLRHVDLALNLDPSSNLHPGKERACLIPTL